MKVHSFMELFSQIIERQNRLIPALIHRLMNVPDLAKQPGKPV